MNTGCARFFATIFLLGISTQALAQVSSGGVYKLRNECSNKLVDVSEVSLQDGARIHLWEDIGGKNQQWKATAADSGYFSFTAMHSGKALDVEGWGSFNGVQLQQWGAGNQPNQQWKIISDGGGFHRMEARHAPGKMLDVFGAGTANGTKIQLWANGAACAQRWKFEPVSTGSDPLQTLIYDMTPPHEGRPHGVAASVDWAVQPRVGMGNNPGNFRAMIAWGQVYEAIEGNPATNSRVQLRNIKAYYLSKRDNQWRLLQQSLKVQGQAYREDFGGDINKPADRRDEPDGTISVRAGGGYNFHFWTPTGRTVIDPADIAGVWASVEGRLILDNPSGVDDRAQARYLLSAGADYWLDVNAQWDQWKTNGDIGIGKFKYVKADWQSFNMTTLTADQLRQNPPPVSAPMISSVVKIMPLGDSLTESSGPGWRGFLQKSLGDRGYNVDFVGTNYGKPGLPNDAGFDADPDHEGHGGFTIGPGPSKADDWTSGRGNLYVNLDQYMTKQPDVVLLIIGINDHWNVAPRDPNYKVERDGPVRLGALIDRIHQIKPDTKVIVASLLPVGFDANFGSAFSAAVPGVASARANTYFVDMRNLSRLATGDWSDGVHLTESGDRKVANVWLGALQQVLSK